MKQTIVAIYSIKLNSKDNEANQIKNISNKEFLSYCTTNGEILTLNDFEQRFNLDELDFSDTIIRFIEAELEVIGCK